MLVCVRLAFRTRLKRREAVRFGAGRASAREHVEACARVRCLDDVLFLFKELKRLARRTDRGLEVASGAHEATTRAGTVFHDGDTPTVAKLVVPSRPPRDNRCVGVLRDAGKTMCLRDEYLDTI